MANPRSPIAKAKLTGATVNHPGRHKGRKSPTRTRPLGDPYAAMTERQREIWDEFRIELPWLNGSHRTLLRLACVLTERMDKPDVGVSTLQALGSVLSKLGATPVDETKVGAGGDEDEDPADKFFN